MDYSKPFQRVRLSLSFSSGKLFVYSAPIVEIDFTDSIERKLSEELGIDPLRNWNRDLLLKKLLREKERIIGEILLDQKIFAGVGNILRNEILHRAGVRPDRKVRDLNKIEISKIIDYCKILSQKFLDEKIRKGRIKDILMVYNKKKCGKCGNKVTFYRNEITSRKHFIAQFAKNKNIFTSN
jgi:endonuclease-8